MSSIHSINYNNYSIQGKSDIQEKAVFFKLNQESRVISPKDDDDDDKEEETLHTGVVIGVIVIASIGTGIGGFVVSKVIVKKKKSLKLKTPEMPNRPEMSKLPVEPFDIDRIEPEEPELKGTVQVDEKHGTWSKIAQSIEILEKADYILEEAEEKRSVRIRRKKPD